VSQHDVTEFMREDGREAGLVRQYVYQAATQDDGMAYCERLKR